MEGGKECISNYYQKKKQDLLRIAPTSTRLNMVMQIEDFLEIENNCSSQYDRLHGFKSIQDTLLMWKGFALKRNPKTNALMVTIPKEYRHTRHF